MHDTNALHDLTEGSHETWQTAESDLIELGNQMDDLAVQSDESPNSAGTIRRFVEDVDAFTVEAIAEYRGIIESVAAFAALQPVSNRITEWLRQNALSADPSYMFSRKIGPSRLLKAGAQFDGNGWTHLIVDEFHLKAGRSLIRHIVIEADAGVITSVQLFVDQHLSGPFESPAEYDDIAEREELAEAIVEAWKASGDTPAIARRLHLPESDVEHVVRTGQFPARQQVLAFDRK